MNPLYDAIRRHDHLIIEILSRSDLGLNDPVDQGASVLFAAILEGDVEIVRVLLKAGSDPNYRAAEPAATIYAETPPDLAMTARYLMDWDRYHPIVVLLHEYGARDAEGNPERFDDLDQLERRSREWQSRNRQH